MGGRPATTATHATHSAPQAATEKNPAQNCAICCSRGRVEINNKSKLNVCLLDTLASSSGFSWDVSALILLLSAEFYVLFIYFRSALLCVRLLAPEKKDQKKNLFHLVSVAINFAKSKGKVLLLCFVYFEGVLSILHWLANALFGYLLFLLSFQNFPHN